MLPPDSKKVSPFFVFYLIHSQQIGVAVLGFERYVAKSAGYDAWISVILSGLSIMAVVWFCYRILIKDGHDIISVHHQIFGKYIGNVLNVALVSYASLLVLLNLRTYVEVIQVWMFPETYHWVFIALILLLAYSFVSGGFRVVTGICFLSVIYGIPLLFVKYFPLREAQVGNLLPIFSHSFSDIMEATKTMTLNYLGYETLLIFFPFIKDGKKSEKWAYYGVLASIGIYLLTILTSFVYFDQDQLRTTIWATLTLWKIVDLIIIERFEYIGIAAWLFIVLPNIALGLWAASRAINRFTPLTQRVSLKGVAAAVLIGAVLITERTQIDQLNFMANTIGFYLAYVYIPLIYICQLAVNKWRVSK
ncbi:GerAB/ArcD/ProY family transporter [Metabacillus sp. KIGAM252]|uniref:GerAB/ArcD/ProY family transporter n=1 Tax=Metabacillus flavus TaxID=2823519 RepID=A0ABS5LF68_9BACI|nr:GerAB/ArcD/ProY family transporter [Metabacillus flavus]MBS2969153.1 GerAB/ArcD/ProY family transporter [Metabacillus flavus]